MPVKGLPFPSRRNQGSFEGGSTENIHKWGRIASTAPCLFDFLLILLLFFPGEGGGPCAGDLAHQQQRGHPSPDVLCDRSIPQNTRAPITRALRFPWQDVGSPHTPPQAQPPMLCEASIHGVLPSLRNKVSAVSSLKITELKNHLSCKEPLQTI